MGKGFYQNPALPRGRHLRHWRQHQLLARATALQVATVRRFAEGLIHACPQGRRRQLQLPGTLSTVFQGRVPHGIHCTPAVYLELLQVAGPGRGMTGLKQWQIHRHRHPRVRRSCRRQSRQHVPSEPRTRQAVARRLLRVVASLAEAIGHQVIRPYRVRQQHAQG